MGHKSALMPVKIWEPAIYYLSMRLWLRSSNDFLESRSLSDCGFADDDGKYCPFNNNDHILPPNKPNTTLHLFENFPVHDHLRIGPMWVSTFALIFPISECRWRSPQSATVPQVSSCPDVSPIFYLRTAFSINCIPILIIRKSIVPNIYQSLLLPDNSTTTDGCPAARWN